VPLTGPAKLLRILIGESDRHHGQPMYTALVELLRSHKIAGATVLRGVEGYGGHSVVHSARMMDMSSDLPIVVEAIDTPERIAAVIPDVRGIVREGLVTLQDIEIAFAGPVEAAHE
jgi:PII-like signaling protein